MTRIIQIVGNSGAGKSVLALNLGVALTKKGRDVLLVDSNLYNPDIENYSDIEASEYINECLTDESLLEAAISLSSSGLKILPARLEESQDDEKHKKINKLLLGLTGKSEIILVDSFSHSPAMHHSMHHSDEAIFVTNDDIPSIIKSRDFIRKIESGGPQVMGVVVNRRRKENLREHIESLIGKKVIAELPSDEIVTNSINNRQAFYLTNPEREISKRVFDLASLIDLK